MRPGAADGGAHRGAHVDLEVVEHDHVARSERRNQLALDPEEEGRAVDRPSITQGASIPSQRRAARKVVVLRLPKEASPRSRSPFARSRAAPPCWSASRFRQRRPAAASPPGPGAAPSAPAGAPSPDDRSRWPAGIFLKLWRSVLRKRHTVSCETRTPRSSRSASLKSCSARTSRKSTIAANASSWSLKWLSRFSRSQTVERSRLPRHPASAHRVGTDSWSASLSASCTIV
jgi:hypothetical protein